MEMKKPAGKNSYCITQKIYESNENGAFPQTFV